MHLHKQSLFTIALLCLFTNIYAQYRIEVIDTANFELAEGVELSKTSFRGLSVVDDNTIWVSGSRGTIARSTNGGKTFAFTQLKGYEKSDFRDIEAFDANTAIIMSSGTPAVILKTTNGGATWKETYRQNDSVYFLDAMDFWDEKRGMVVGDPINAHFVLLETKDGGETWQELDTSITPKAMSGEAVFAASGTSLRCWNKNEFGFVTGGQRTRWFTYNVSFYTYYFIPIEIIHGKSSQGIFSFTKSAAPFFVGGDYLCDTCNNTNAAKAFWPKVKNQEMVIGAINSNSSVGYRSCVEELRPRKLFVACGTRGVDIYTEKDSWISISETPFHVVRKSKKGKAVFLAGPRGRIGKLVY